MHIHYTLTLTLLLLPSSSCALPKLTPSDGLYSRYLYALFTAPTKEIVPEFINAFEQRCVKDGYDKKNEMRQVITKVEERINYYHKFMQLPCTDRIRTHAKEIVVCFTIALLCAGGTYFTLHNYLKSSEKIKTIKDELSRLGASYTTVFADSASTFGPQYNKVAIEKQLRSLLYWSQCNSILTTGFWSIISSIGAIVFSSGSIRGTLDILYADYYYDLYSCIGKELTEYINASEL